MALAAMFFDQSARGGWYGRYFAVRFHFPGTFFLWFFFGGGVAVLGGGSVSTWAPRPTLFFKILLLLYLMQNLVLVIDGVLANFAIVSPVFFFCLHAQYSKHFSCPGSTHSIVRIFRSAFSYCSITEGIEIVWCTLTCIDRHSQM